MKSISLRVNEEMLEQLENLKSMLPKNQTEELSTSEIIRVCVNFTNINYGKGNMEWAEVMELINAYVKTALITQLVGVDFDFLDRILYAIEKVNEENYTEEVKANNRLFNDENPITLGELLRFKYRLLPETFLEAMGIDWKNYKELTDNELADYILELFKDKDFSDKAESHVRVQSSL
ncbi:hypothetical protein [Paenibacillus sp. O199]|uniref:hypothetical protein n=1 Tax=Paenibacillus sp. O199 TaxID=1643925 RepID=UPI0007BEC5FE|nr:hypothetical protein [Paenibacillus sp. O199]